MKIQISRERVPVLLTVFLLLGLTIRLWAIREFPPNPTADALDYHQIAQHIVRGEGFVNEGHPTAFRPPGYPLFLAFIYFVFGESPEAAAISQSGLGMLIIVMSYLIGKELFSVLCGLLAAFLAAVYPGFFWLPRVLLSENLAVFFVLLTVYLSFHFLKTERWRWAWSLGLVLGVGTLVRGANQIYTALLLLAFCFSFWKRGRVLVMLAKLGAILLGIVLTVTPWSVRNYALFGELSPIATNDGITLYSSYWPPIRNGKKIWGANASPENDSTVAQSALLANEVKASLFLRKQTLGRLGKAPLYPIKLIPQKLAFLLVPYDWEIFPHRGSETKDRNPFYVFILIFAVCGVFRSVKGKTEFAWLLYIPMVAVVIQSIVFYGSPRFRLPAEGSLVVLAAFGTVCVLQGFRRSRLALHLIPREN